MKMNEWEIERNESMDGSMDGRSNENTYERMDGWSNECMHEYMNEWSNECMHGWVNYLKESFLGIPSECKKKPTR